MKNFLLIALLVFSSIPSFARAAEEAEPNCKLMVHTYLKSGKKKLEMEMIHTPNRKVCQAEAQIRKVVSEESPEDIASIKVTFGWAELTN